MSFALLAAVQVALILAITVVSIPLPVIQRDLHLTHAGLALVAQAYGLSFSGLLLLGGRLADRLGRRRAFRLGVIVFGLASAGSALAPNLGAMLAARFAQGCGAALTAPAAMALLGAVFPEPARRARAVAIWGGLAVTGANLGTLLSGIVLTWTSWRWALAVPVVVAAAAALAAPRLLPPGPPAERRRLDVPGASLATMALAGLGFGLVASSDNPWTSATVLAPLAGGALAAAAFAVVEWRSAAPLLPLGFLRPARRSTALLAIALTAAGSAGTTFVLSLYFQQVRGMSPLETSAAFLPFALVIAGGQLAGRLVGRFGPRTVAALGLALTAAGLLLASRIGPSTPYLGPLLAGMVAFPLGMGLAFSGTTVAAVEGVSERQAGLAGSVVNAAMETGPNVGVAAMVAIAGAQDYGRALTAAGIAFAFAAIWIAAALRPSQHEQEE